MAPEILSCDARSCFPHEKLGTSKMWVLVLSMSEGWLPNSSKQPRHFGYWVRVHYLNGPVLNKLSSQHLTNQVETRKCTHFMTERSRVEKALDIFRGGEEIDSTYRFSNDSTRAFGGIALLNNSPRRF